MRTDVAPPGAGRDGRSGTIHDWLRSPAAKGHAPAVRDRDGAVADGGQDLAAAPRARALGDHRGAGAGGRGNLAGAGAAAAQQGVRPATPNGGLPCGRGRCARCGARLAGPTARAADTTATRPGPRGPGGSARLGGALRRALDQGLLAGGGRLGTGRRPGPRPGAPAGRVGAAAGPGVFQSPWKVERSISTSCRDQCLKRGRPWGRAWCRARREPAVPGRLSCRP